MSDDRKRTNNKPKSSRLKKFFNSLQIPANMYDLEGASIWESPNMERSSKNSASNSSLDRLGSAQYKPTGPPSRNFRASSVDIDKDIGSIISSISNSNSNQNGLNNFDQPTNLINDRRNSTTSGAGSDVDSDYGNAFGFKRGTLSLGNYNMGNNNSNASVAAGARNNAFGSASISGGIPSHINGAGSGRFLEKFAAVAEATREVELLGGGVGSLSIGSTSARVPGSSRRTSFLTPEGTTVNKPFHDSSPNSLSESLNNPLNANTSRQSISERIDNYNLSNANSPDQAFKSALGSQSRAMSISSDLNNPSEHNSISFDVNGENVNTSIWNPASAASATTFTPTSNINGDQQQQQQPFPNYPQMFPYGFPFNQPFPMMPMMPPQFLDSQNMFNAQQAQQGSAVESPPNGDVKPSDAKNTELPKLNEDQQPKTFSPFVPGIHLQPQPLNGGFNSQSPFVYPQSFSPYGFLPPQLNGTPDVQNNDINQQFPSNGTTNNTNNHNNINNKRRSPKQPSSSSNGNGVSRSNGNGKGPKNHIYRSPLLEEFRNNTSKEYRLKDIFGSAVEFSKDQHGSRFIQQQLEISSDEENEVIFNEIREASLELMTDVFGNYVIQKYFEHGSDTQRQVLLEQMKNQVQHLSMQMYGCRVVQKAIEYVPLNDQISIITELKDSIVSCIKDQNGNHVIQKSIEKIPIEKIEFILDSLKTQIYHLSTHTYGCRVIQRLLEFSKPKDQEYILNELNKFTYFLIQDQFGNYVIQHIIEHGKPSERKLIVDTVLGSVVDFSKHKFASNVVEKCVIFGDDEQRSLILDEVLKNNEKDDDKPVDDRSPLGLMMKDQFANYVVQKLVDVTKGSKKKILIKKIKQFLKQISKTNYGKHLASIEKLIVLSETAITSDDEE
ncbi:hypothetical protein BN7_999 [Wickerhamomyces ciferrii]|uniref:Pumilio homology domain family member 3 n=1 Tax=Wickerhamomyces ciferrii (strain ATCC 14091 / BCRC 22168 / CBS 111 / JCM 3599 / NBRC 0793 / NRRL Y-1031 F-60-10) TaxID=1206466 RepID=K0KK03_WICCF|nr:uncharacterized protein BN7_999 [Wickerhamomyces ciferrii]CCH41458.1 hypothetical protein BN7_999 [Wickerhamomyces ciferrii]